MNITTRKLEVDTRAIARWGSLGAAVLFGVGIITDPRLSANLMIAEWEQILLIMLVFVGYLLAWRNSCELTGSLIALGALAGYWTWCRTQVEQCPELAVLMVAAPALFHVLAVLLHRMVLRKRIEAGD